MERADYPKVFVTYYVNPEAKQPRASFLIDILPRLKYGGFSGG